MLSKYRLPHATYDMLITEDAYMWICKSSSYNTFYIFLNANGQTIDIVDSRRIGCTRMGIHMNGLEVFEL